MDGYINRIQYFKESCHGKAVLHLGCSSGRYLHHRLKRGTLLHQALANASRDIYGIDIDEDSLRIMREQLGMDNLYYGDVQELDKVAIDRRFDVVIAGDILEHISCPGAMLDGVKRFLHKDGRLIISTNNAFGINYQLKRWLGVYREHVEHVCFFSPETLQNLFERHDYRVENVFGAYTEPPSSLGGKLRFAIGALPLKLFPILAGTIVVVARPG